MVRSKWDKFKEFVKEMFGRLFIIPLEYIADADAWRAIGLWILGFLLFPFIAIIFFIGLALMIIYAFFIPLVCALIVIIILKLCGQI